MRSVLVSATVMGTSPACVDGSHAVSLIATRLFGFASVRRIMEVDSFRFCVCQRRDEGGKREKEGEKQLLVKKQEGQVWGSFVTYACVLYCKYREEGANPQVASQQLTDLGERMWCLCFLALLN